MESNWRWNIYETGWSFGPYDLMARIRGITFYPLYLCRMAGTTTVDEWYVLAPGQFIYAGGFSTLLKFPYGIDVVPDQT